MRNEPRYGSLRDYLEVVRRHRLLILLVVVVCTGAAVGLSARETKSYEADASVELRDLSTDIALIGRSQLPVQNAAIEASAAAARVKTLAVAEEAQKLLGTQTPPQVLRSKVSSQVELRTTYIVATATDENPRTAALIANAFARGLAIIINREQRARFANAEESLRKQYKEFLKGGRRSDLADATQVVTRASYEQAIAQLDSLQRIAKPAILIEPAEIPGTPVSPKPVRNGVLGFLAGLILAFGAAFMRDALDRRLRGAAEIRAELGKPIIGNISSDGLGAVSFGASGARKMPVEDVEAARILRTNLTYLDVDAPPKLIAVTSALPEEGKSTVAASLATASALAGQLTLLIETDLRRPALSDRLGLTRQPGLSDYLTGDVGPADVLQSLKLGDPDDASAPTLVVIAAGRAIPRPAELLQSQRMAALLEQVREAYDVVIIDTAPMLPVVDTLSLLPRVDAIAICVRSKQTTRDQARALVSAISRVPERPTGVVVTGISRRDEEAYAYYSYAYASST